ncbi:MAG: hypothetical protein EOM83_15060 [Clostridia bacterium]|nr:hypothetical protein [Clostridia bacterium]
METGEYHLEIAGTIQVAGFLRTAAATHSPYDLRFAPCAHCHAPYSSHLSPNFLLYALYAPYATQLAFRATRLTPDNKISSFLKKYF